MLLLSLPARAQWAGWDYDFDQDKKEWTEIQAQIPAYPKDENLRKFEMDARTPHRYFIDSASVSVGEDKVIRYTLVVRTGGGAFATGRHLTYEKKTPLCNLYTAMLDRMGAPVSRFGDSNGKLAGLDDKGFSGASQA